MNFSEEELSGKQREFIEFLEDATKIDNKNNLTTNINKGENLNDSIHLNSLITKNISLFTKNHNYKLLTWLIVQLVIFSLFIFSINIFKLYLIPYLNSI